jgi:hypothetical protein
MKVAECSLEEAEAVVATLEASPSRLKAKKIMGGVTPR